MNQFFHLAFMTINAKGLPLISECGTPRPITTTGNGFRTIDSITDNVSTDINYDDDFAFDHARQSEIDPVATLTDRIAYWDDRIIGGNVTTPHSWPWMASIQRFGSHVCGGALIGDQHIYSSPVHINCCPIYHQIYTFNQTKQHILFDKYFSRAYDLALVRLSKAAAFSDNVDAICLPTFLAAPGRPCVVVGWGVLTARSGVKSPTLQQAKVPIMSPALCSMKYPGLIEHGSMLCAGDIRGGVDACQGDSGGPLMCAELGRWQLMGIVSWGFGCASPQHPGVYTKVLSGVGWIRAEVIRLDFLRKM